MPDYHVRPATLEDAEVLVRHREAMFSEMGTPPSEMAIAGPMFRSWLADAMSNGIYHAWVVETDGGEVVAGGGATVLPWPPGPQHPGGQVAFVYNVFTERSHRGRGLARSVMDAIHEWCRGAGIQSIALNASSDGRPLYESMGYHLSESPTMFRRIG
jgi:GNAT superfamily N-acetyltransferase